jgi:murein L,D-transpeptidase YafK
MSQQPHRTATLAIANATDRPPRTPSHDGPAPLVAAVSVAIGLALALVGCAETPQHPATYADQVVVKKSQRKLQLMNKGQVLREYRIALGENPDGHKLQEGDHRTPVGDYVLDWRNPNSAYHKSIHVSYPNERDRAFAQALGVDPGGMIMVHGLPNEVQSQAVRAEFSRRDWTNGCIAVQDQEIDEIWRLVRDGTPIRIMN